MNMEYVKELLVLLIGSSLVSNVVLSQFLGLCPFLGVSRKTNTAAGMGVAVIFVITLASAVAGVIYEFVLVRFHVEYLKTIVFILVIAALVQFVEMFLRKSMPSLYEALDHQCTERVRNPYRYRKRLCHGGGILSCHRDIGRDPGKAGIQ